MMGLYTLRATKNNRHTFYISLYTLLIVSLNKSLLLTFVLFISLEMEINLIIFTLLDVRSRTCHSSNLNFQEKCQTTVLLANCRLFLSKKGLI